MRSRTVLAITRCSSRMCWCRRRWRPFSARAENRVQGFLAAGHVCAVMGYSEYPPLAAKYRVPIVVTGFEPLDLLQGIYMCVSQLEQGRFEVENQYSRVVQREGNLPGARARGEGIPRCRSQMARPGVDSAKWIGPFARVRRLRCRTRFGLPSYAAEEDPDCISGLILQGVKKPRRVSRLRHALHSRSSSGRPMVSSRRRLRRLLPLSPLADRCSSRKSEVADACYKTPGLSTAMSGAAERYRACPVGARRRGRRMHELLENLLLPELRQSHAAGAA